MEPTKMNSTQNRPIRAINKCVRVHADDVFLLGDLQIPERATSLVIFSCCSGRSRNNPRNLHAARLIREKGIGTLVCDLLNEDEELEDEATEAYRHDAEFLARRLIAVTKWVASAPDTRDLQIGFFGACAGGAAAFIAAAKLHETVAAIVTRGARTDLAAKALPRVKCPTLLVVGEDDTVGMELNREALPHLECRKELKVLPGASHLFGEPHKLEEMAMLGAEWFLRHLQGPATD
jgi:dienelactone hydrolase